MISLFANVVLILLTLLALTTAGGVKEAFDDFTNSLPRNTLKKQIDLQSSHFKTLSFFQQARGDLFPYNHFHPNQHYGDYGEYHSLEVKVNVGIVFLGFPDNAIPRLRDLFFNDLERRDQLFLQDFLNMHMRKRPSPGSAMINHQFHVVDTSFHADEVVRKYIRLLLRPNFDSQQGTKFYLNAWELEEAFESLNWHMQHHQNDNNKLRKERPYLTVFVMNLDLNAELGSTGMLDDVDASYIYQNGFSSHDLDIIRRNATCLTMAKKLLANSRKNLQTSRKVFESDSSGQSASLKVAFESIEDIEASLSGKQNEEEEDPSAWNQYYGGDEDKVEDTPDQEFFRLNEVKSSKAWARGFSDSILGSPEQAKLETRVLRILGNTDHLSSFDIYKHELAKDIAVGHSTRNVDDDIENPGVAWLGTKGLMWIDLQAQSRTNDIESLREIGETLKYSAMSMINVEEGEGRQDKKAVGHEKIPHQKEMHALRHSLHQHYSHCSQILMHIRSRDDSTSEDESLHEQIQSHVGLLPELLHSGELTPDYTTTQIDPNDMVENFNELQQLIVDGVNSDRISKFCAIIYLQQALISSSLAISINLEKAATEAYDENEDHHNFYLELMEFHNQGLEEVVELSDMFVGKGHFSIKGFSSKSIHDSLATLSSSILQMSRLLLSKPVTLLPHTSQLHTHLAVQEYVRHSIGNFNIFDSPVTLMAGFVIESSTRQELGPKSSEDASKSNAYALLKELREDALNSAVFHGMSEIQHEAILMQAYQAQMESFNFHGADYYEDDYMFGGYGRHTRGHPGDGPSKRQSSLMQSATAQTPPLLVPKSIVIDVYIVVMQDLYRPLVEKESSGDFVKSVQYDPRSTLFEDDNGLGQSLGFDMSVFMSEVSRLKLPNQEMSVAVHMISGVEEANLYLGIESCRRYRTEASSAANTQSFDHNISYYFSADCVWRHLQHSDSIESARTIVSQQKGEQTDSILDLPDTQHVGMFMLSVDSLSPFYLDSPEDDLLHQSVAFADSVIVVQNKQVRIPSTVTSADCGGSFAPDGQLGPSQGLNGRNPLHAALEAVSRVILGAGALSSPKLCHYKAHHAPLRVSHVRFSDLELAAAFRNRILRSIDFGEAMEDSLQGDINELGDEYTPELLTYTKPWSQKAIGELNSFRWDKAAAITNMIVRTVWKKRNHFDKFLHRQKILNKDKDTFSILDEFGERDRWLGDDGFGIPRYHSPLSSDEEKQESPPSSTVKSLMFLALKTLFVAFATFFLSYGLFLPASRILSKVVSLNKN